MWNAQTVRQLHDWYATPEGDYALEQENSLFQRLISQWPRRGKTLLDVGCGAGIFLEMLWHYGFDVTGFDTSDELLDMARERMGSRADFQLGKAEYLPFDDKEFDYVSLLSVLEYVERPDEVLAEAFRVASRGVIIGVMNSFSLYQIQRSRSRPFSVSPQRARRMNLWSLTRMIRQACPGGRIYARSVLLGPPSTWKKKSLWRWANTLQTQFPIGAYLGVCVDTQPRVPMTPLLLRAKERAFKVCSGFQPEASREGTAPSRNVLKAFSA